MNEWIQVGKSMLLFGLDGYIVMRTVLASGLISFQPFASTCVCTIIDDICVYHIIIFQFFYIPLTSEFACTVFLKYFQNFILEFLCFFFLTVLPIGLSFLSIIFSDNSRRLVLLLNAKCI